MSSRFFSPDEFKTWINKEDSAAAEKQSRFVGTLVESKLEADQLINKIETENDDVYELIEDFVENGGAISKVEGRLFFIEVDSGLFAIPRKYVRRQ